MEAIFLIAFAIVFISYAVHTGIHALEHRKSKLVENKNLHQVIGISMFIGWGAWFLMCFSDPVKMALPDWARYSGLILFVTGIFIFILAHQKLKGFGDNDYLVTEGIYSKIRHPIYRGFILCIIWFPVFTQALATLASGVIWVSHILYWKILEENDLEEKYGEYKEYKRRTWF
ncbi:MAG: hypothetical protein A7315_11960 [Candidatus Altiarchaeales archaeon WOR_SM1_79]|nr:MAG: hypothetical protein A7315_11960 [Candidatus Altiarchaeales archaeon WOR_SM1_79]